MRLIIVCICILVSISFVVVSHLNLESGNFSDQASLSKYFQFDNGSLDKLDRSSLKQVAIAGFGEAQRLKELYLKNKLEQQSQIRWLSWFMLGQVLLLSFFALKCGHGKS
jgi:hypothetical protein